MNSPSEATATVPIPFVITAKLTSAQWTKQHPPCNDAVLSRGHTLTLPRHEGDFILDWRFLIPQWHAGRSFGAM
ncbi:hypothetical protein Rcae01_02192 [Novipirellula caenicola]|uniref:Uncharacterized protein n=1 Tax=Novipirellula caenicola TaxID=1536901 RepID=A0ABP9VNJ9_9BACT